MPKFQVTIVGLGLVGTSIGLALKRVTSDALIVGHDKEHTVAGEARKRKAVDRAEWNLISACEKADLVVIATPLDEVETTLNAIGPNLRPGSLVTDTASLKEPVLTWAEESLGEGIGFVGGHPIILKDTDGSDGASADLFDGVTYSLCALPTAAPEAVERATNFVAALGGTPYFVDAVEHDSLVAAVSHLPIIWAAVLLGTVSETEAWREAARLAGAAFSNCTSPIGTDPATQSALCRANRQNLLRWIDACQGRLNDIREALLSEDAEGIGQTFERAVETRGKWLAREVEPKPGFPEYRVGLGETFLGRLAGRK